MKEAQMLYVGLLVDHEREEAPAHELLGRPVEQLDGRRIGGQNAAFRITHHEAVVHRVDDAIDIISRNGRCLQPTGHPPERVRKLTNLVENRLNVAFFCLNRIHTVGPARVPAL